MCDRPGIFPDDWNPKFLFTWEGTRDKKEDAYHSHDFLEVAFILSGTGKYRIDGRLYDVSEGDLLILNPGTQHQALIIEGNDTPITDFYVAVSGFQLKDQPENVLPLPQGEKVLHTAGELRQKLFRICAAMEAENAMGRQGSYYMMKSYTMQILLLIIREQYEPVKRMAGCAFESANKRYIVEQIISYFEEHYNEKISLEQIAENMYLSPFYVSRIFKSETGDTPIRHLINIRLEKARELLANGWKGSIQEVAASVGYEDAYHFSKLFKKRFGVSPSQVRSAR